MLFRSIVVSLGRAVQKLLATGKPIENDTYYRVDGYDLKLAPAGNRLVVTDLRLNQPSPGEPDFQGNAYNILGASKEPSRYRQRPAEGPVELTPNDVKGLGYETQDQEELDGENKTDTNAPEQQGDGFPGLDAGADPGDFYTYVRAGFSHREAANLANKDALARRQSSDAASQAKLPPRKVPADVQRAEFANDNPEEFNRILYELHRKIIAIRLDQTYRGDIRRKGNMGVAILNLGPQNTDRTVFASSSIPEPDEKLRSIGFVGQTPKIFDTKTIPNARGIEIPRNQDSEYKILNHVANIIGSDQSMSGSVDLFTERAPCESCAAVIEAFRKRYPNITLRVYDRGDTLPRPR